MTTKLRWGILATGSIAKTFAMGVLGSQTGQLVAVGSRSKESADTFADQFGIPHRHASYEALLADKEVDAVYIATPHPLHARWAILATEAKKHVLCEKPIGVNHAQAMAIFDSARRNDVFVMEAFMYRCSPQTRKIVELLRDNAIGQVRAIQATFSFHHPRPFNPNTRLTAQDSAGGGILDVGCYPVSFSRLVAGVASGKDFADPTEVKALGHLESNGIDGWSAAVLKFPGDIIAQCATGVQVSQENVARIYGYDGNIFVPNPWVPAREGGTTKIILSKHGAEKPEEITIESPAHLYSYEVDVVAANIERRQAPSPAMSWDDSLGNMRTLDQWRQQIGLVYEFERAENIKETLTGRPLAVGPKHNMKYGKIAGIDKPISRFVMGVDNQTFPPHAFAMFDAFFEAGGNAFDTAHIYSGGNLERIFGQWVRNRNVRDKVVIIGKGAHTPFCDPENLTKQLLITLERLQTDHLDIYFMHRDNPDIPVSAFVDVLNEHHRAGRIRGVFGGSNWSIERTEQANAYAKSKGLVGFGALSNNFSLAAMINPIWAGCIATSDRASRDWFTRTQMPLFPWSSQARGFFTDRSNPNDTSDKELVNTWYSPDNFRRKDRVYEMAKKRNVEPIQIAAAYVLNQPFPTFALIGPRQLSELRSTLPALDIQLSPRELQWLNLEVDSL